MLFRIDPHGKVADAIRQDSFTKLSYHERYDIQEWVLSNPELLGERLLVISSEFAGFDRTAERLDVLALSPEGRLVVVELKRSATGTTAELQALRYAAYCSTLELEDVVELRAAHLKRRGEESSTEAVEEEIRGFVELPDFNEIDDKPRIILAADDFGPELTSTVLWLRDFEVDIRCVRLTPYSVEGALLVDSTVLIPLPEAEEFLVRRERKDAARGGRQRSGRPTIDEFVERVPEPIRPLFLEMRRVLADDPQVKETVFQGLVSYRRRSDNAWVTWLTHTKTQARFALPDDHDFPEQLAVKSNNGWTTLGLASRDELDAAVGLLKERIEMVRRDGGSSVLTGG